MCNEEVEKRRIFCFLCNIITHFPLFFWYLLSKILSFSKHMKMCNLNYIRKSPFFKVGTPLFSLANVISSQLAGSVQKQLPFFSIPTLFGNIAKSPPSTTTRTRAHTLRAHTHAVSTMQEPREPRDQEARDQAAALAAHHRLFAGLFVLCVR